MRKATEDYAESLKKESLILPREERRRKQAADAVSATRVTKADKPSSADTDITKLMDKFKSDLAVVAKQLEEMQAASAEYRNSYLSPTSDSEFKSGTSNAVHDPNEEGVYASRDGRTVPTVHHVNRKISTVNKSDRVHVQKSEGHLDFSKPFVFSVAPVA